MTDAKEKKQIKQIVEKGEGKTNEGWEPLPLSLKVISLLLLIDMLGALLSLGTDNISGFFLLGTILTGALAIGAIALVKILANIVFLAAIWKRYNWGWNYGMIYLGYFALNTLIAFTHPSAPIFILVIEIIVNLLFIVIFIRAKDYFE